MVNMRMRLEEGVREGRLTKEEGSSAKRYGAFGKKKDGEAHAVTSHVKPRRLSVRRKTVRPAVNQHQAYQPQNNNQTSTSYERKRVTFDPIPMTYAEIYPSLIERKLITPRDPSAIPTNPQWWYKPELHCVYHSGAPGHGVENCYPLKTKVQDLVRSGILCFKDVKMKASMKVVHKALIHHICLPSISVHHFDQSKLKDLRIVSQGNPNSTVHQLCLAHEATSTHDQIQSRSPHLVKVHSLQLSPESLASPEKTVVYTTVRSGFIHSTLPDQGVKELRDEDHSHAWIREREELLQQLRENDALIEFIEHEVIDEPDDVVNSLLPQSSKFWKRKYDRLAKEKADMEAAYEREVKRLRAAYLPVSIALDDCF
ncbi:hypothetical protein KIW84_071807 [Lathyrus oleraceus]|uniref:Uncharacterized protein n=1 Tax=Pisum sativum TaxID=3888 RepID=A0A9D4ZV78_PEA|nr:hypothetical protein KIW84_071807 [Pisum sativum]